MGEDIRKLDYGQHVVAGTPGRVFGETRTRAHTHTQSGVPTCGLITSIGDGGSDQGNGLL